MQLAPIIPTEPLITVTDKLVVMRWNLPGCQDIQVYVDEQTLRLNCSIDAVEERDNAKIAYSCLFQQRLLLPVAVRGLEAKTSYQNGVLEVIIDRA